MQDVEPLILADGTKVWPDKTVEKPGKLAIVKVASETSARKALNGLRTKIGDLPVADSAIANPMVAFVTYELIGLDDEAIAFMLATTKDKLAELRTGKPYKQMLDFVTERIYDSERENAKGILAASANTAATKLVETLGAEDEALQFSAAKTILEMNGVGKAVERRGNDTMLEIVMISGDKNKADTTTIKVGF